MCGHMCMTQPVYICVHIYMCEHICMCGHIYVSSYTAVYVTQPVSTQDTYAAIWRLYCIYSSMRTACVWYMTQLVFTQDTVAVYVSVLTQDTYITVHVSSCCYKRVLMLIYSSICVLC
jgi:hypothetical protein